MDELRCHERQEVAWSASNRVENSRLPLRRRERAMLRFRQMTTLRNFVSLHANIHNHFNLERHLIDRETYRTRHSAALAKWQMLATWVPPSNTDLQRPESRPP